MKKFLLIFLSFIFCLSFVGCKNNKPNATISTYLLDLTYEHEKFGPTIFNQEYEEISLLTSKYKREIYENEYGSTIKIISNNNFDLSQFEEIEINIIDTIIKLLKNKKVTEISEMSHSEKAWSKTKRYEKISFKYAMDLNIINN